MKKSRPGVAITDLLGIAAVFVLVAALGLPTLERARELSKRMVCAVNLKGLGSAGHVYAEVNQGQWMTPPFMERETFQVGIDYLCKGSSRYDFTCVGFERERESRSPTAMNPAAGSTAISTTRSYWMLVRSGDVPPQQFICPSSRDDMPDPTEQIELYYDFAEYRNISYGYLVPFGPVDTRPRSGADSRVVFAADKGPFYFRNTNIDFLSMGPNGVAIETDHSPKVWRRANSPNHGGQSNGEGQNALHADGHVEFYRKPTSGIDSDNIYTLMSDEWGVLPYNRIHGYSPHQSPATNPYPGKEAFGASTNTYATTDSLIYP